MCTHIIVVWRFYLSIQLSQLCVSDVFKPTTYSYKNWIWRRKNLYQANTYADSFIYISQFDVYLKK